MITDAGYEEYKYARGRGLGRSAHDGGPLLGPAWARRGLVPYQRVEVGPEEDIVVTERGTEYRSASS